MIQSIFEFSNKRYFPFLHGKEHHHVDFSRWPHNHWNWQHVQNQFTVLLFTIPAFSKRVDASPLLWERCFLSVFISELTCRSVKGSGRAHWQNSQQWFHLGCAQGQRRAALHIAVVQLFSFLCSHSFWIVVLTLAKLLKGVPWGGRAHGGRNFRWLFSGCVCHGCS